jgi:phosphopantothenoylcysteine synthetase/decarboxylase
VDKNSLRGKSILITAGPTLVPIDDVRVISNISSGTLGILLAKDALRCGLKVDLFLGPVGEARLKRSIRVARFRYFSELSDLVRESLKTKKYDIILHAAAVSDYLCKSVKGKISSQKKNLFLKLRRAPKIIELTRRLAPESYLVFFKLEGRLTRAVLLKRALSAMKRVGADLAVANSFKEGGYRGFILSSKGILAKASSKKALSSSLFRILKIKVE